MNTQPLYLDATMLYRWRHLDPVGIVRLERLLAAHLRFRTQLGTADYVLWDDGYRAATEAEAAILDGLLTEGISRENARRDPETRTIATPTEPVRRGGVKASARRQALKFTARLPDHLRPFAEQAAWSVATLTVESARHVRRRRQLRTASMPPTESRTRVRHRIDFTGGADLVALGLGWEYIEHESMYHLAKDYGVRIHMPAFDLIPVSMPQMNAGQSDLVHRYYAEMAHYADTITSISVSTSEGLRSFFDSEMLPIPTMATNQPPSFSLGDVSPSDPTRRRHRLEGEEFVLSVSTVEVRKNHLLLAKIWAECARGGVLLPKLAIVGRIGWDITEFLLWSQHAPELRDRVAIYTDVDDAELEQMYKDALFTVFPSRVEGWGMPIAEALAYGKVCVHSNDPAQVEASQGLMPSLHPDDFVAWRSEIERLCTDGDYRRELERVVHERYVPRSVEDYCATFEAVLARRRRSSR